MHKQALLGACAVAEPDAGGEMILVWNEYAEQNMSLGSLYPFQKQIGLRAQGRECTGCAVAVQRRSSLARNWVYAVVTPVRGVLLSMTYIHLAMYAACSYQCLIFTWQCTRHAPINDFYSPGNVRGVLLSMTYLPGNAMVEDMFRQTLKVQKIPGVKGISFKYLTFGDAPFRVDSIEVNDHHGKEWVQYCRAPKHRSAWHSNELTKSQLAQHTHPDTQSQLLLNIRAFRK
eukprot:1136876-Pelagomonas_calceolata.AAC.1